MGTIRIARTQYLDWYTDRYNSATREIVSKHGFLYDALKAGARVAAREYRDIKAIQALTQSVGDPAEIERITQDIKEGRIDAYLSD